MSRSNVETVSKRLYSFIEKEQFVNQGKFLNIDENTQKNGYIKMREAFL